jgi:hypothetical protein
VAAILDGHPQLLGRGLTERTGLWHQRIGRIHCGGGLPRGTTVASRRREAAAGDHTSVFLTSQRGCGSWVARAEAHTRNRHRDTTITSRILVLAREPLAAALIGMLLELDKYEPAFAMPEESPEEAVRRVRPVLVILLDGSLEAANSDVFHARAKGTPVILFGTQRTEAMVRTIAEARRLRWFAMPVDRASLSQVIRDAVPRAPPRSGRDRRAPSARESPDGTLIYRDREGREWQVYDRRVGERRGRGSESGYRAFINDVGEEWRYPLSDDELGERSATALERQLAGAVRHNAQDNI